MAHYRLLCDDGAGASGGLAFDEALMAGYARSSPPRPPTLRLYTYRSHCALVGRYQHLEAEVDLEACRRTGTQVSRRPTGGGAILMGADQLGVALVASATGERPKELLRRLSGGVVAGLASLGIEASFGGKNDLEVGGRKIAGLGLYLDGRGALLFHTSVLADLDVALMLEVLRVPAAKLGGKGVAAVDERVTTVTRETGTAWSGADLREAVAAGFADVLSLAPRPAAPEAEELRLARRLEERYESEGWLHQRSPLADSVGSAVLKTPEGLVRLYLALQGATIKSVLFTGDYNEVPEALVRFEAAAKWARLDPESLRKIAASACGGDTGLGVSPDELARAVARAGRRALAGAAAPRRLQGACYVPEVSHLPPETHGRNP